MTGSGAWFQYFAPRPARLLPSCGAVSATPVATHPHRTADFCTALKGGFSLGVAPCGRHGTTGTKDCPAPRSFQSKPRPTHRLASSSPLPVMAPAGRHSQKNPLWPHRGLASLAAVIGPDGPRPPNLSSTAPKRQAGTPTSVAQNIHRSRLPSSGYTQLKNTACPPLAPRFPHA